MPKQKQTRFCTLAQGERGKRKKLRLYIVRVGRTKFKVLAANCESADRIAGRTLGGIWSKRIKETWKMD